MVTTATTSTEPPGTPSPPPSGRAGDRGAPSRPVAGGYHATPCAPTGELRWHAPHGHDRSKAGHDDDIRRA